MIKIGVPSATIDSPVEHLTACHRRIEERLETLVRAADYLEGAQTSALAAITKSLAFLDSSGALHTQDEENSLFPRLRMKLSGEQIAFLDSLESQHIKADAILARLKQLVEEIANQEPVSGALIGEYRECAAELRSLYAAHIQSEDTVFTAMAKAALNESELAEISLEMRERRTGRLNS